MKILVRLPNWLGDMVMSIPFLEHLQKEFSDAEISVIVKKGLEPLLHYFPPVKEKFVFSKSDYPGIKGAYRFGKQIRLQNKYDIFFILPDSFSSALMGWAIGSKKRIGYSNEGRSIFLSKAYKKNRTVHRVNQYVGLLEQFLGKQLNTSAIQLHNLPTESKKEFALVNVHSEAVSRRLPKEKAISIISHLQKMLSKPIVLIGGPNDVDHTNEIIKGLGNSDSIINKVGVTSLKELPLLMNDAAVMLSTDSGPAHIANAAAVPLVVLFGAGNENSTAPYNQDKRTIIRLGQLPCEPCVKNTCIYGLPKCLELLDENKITNAVMNYLN